jgi:hypothetical protein
MDDKPRIFHILHQDAQEIRQSPFGSVGTIFGGEGLEAVWVREPMSHRRRLTL